ncbi:hypothetical protein THASP1DRAFT_32359 [Thamnocephalis sphaerospora]|uniref:Uncharacterized protein n=1 Tax=Thamnocephalis sphaerospora TaxID=78915 RepID=A0A4P9XJ98_9FUNG|nr:hypothetical protein THASP1DRAFT_32359 [Thamnocephalis sphaerospora]|eukprot:RKP05808.1 hypothetical protein THASP1DRAFT_32359 [Thamnocephalis sphaerospora]
MSSDPAGDDAYLRFLQQANEPLPQTAAVSSTPSPATLHANTRTSLPTETTLAEAYRSVVAAADGLCLISETEADLEAVYVLPEQVPAALVDGDAHQQFLLLLGANPNASAERLDTAAFFERAASAASNAGLANGAQLWRSLMQTLNNLVDDSGHLQVWRVGDDSEAWVYAGGILPDGAGYVGVRALDVET